MELEMYRRGKADLLFYKEVEAAVICCQGRLYCLSGDMVLNLVFYDRHLDLHIDMYTGDVVYRDIEMYY